METKRKVAVLAAAILTMISCTQKKEDDKSAYIGPSEIKVEDGRMTPEVLLSLGRLSDPQLSPDGKWILYGVSYTSIGENRSCRNLFLQEVKGTGDGSLSFGEKIQLTKEGKSISNARWSTDGKSIYYLQGGQVFKAGIADVRKGRKRDGSAEVSKDAAAREGKTLQGTRQLSDVKSGISEFSLSPDQSRIIYISTVPGPVTSPKDYDPALDKARAYVTEDLGYRHWDHWVTERPQSYVAPLGGEKTITEENSMNILGEDAGRYELPLEPFGGIEQLSWSPDGQCVAYSCKKVGTGREYAFSTDTEIYIFKILTGQTVRIPMDGGYDTDPVWSPDGKHLAWLSMARNGYEADKTRLMVADILQSSGSGQTKNRPVHDSESGRSQAAIGTDGQDGITVSNIRDLTAGFDRNAAGPVWSDDSRYLYFNALDNGIQSMFKIEVLDISGVHNDLAAEPVRITPENAWYDFGSPFAIVDGTLLATFCSMEFPNEIVAVNETDEEFTQVSNENGHILNQLDACKTEARRVRTVDGKEMLTWVLYPPKFDSTKVYPAIEIFLGGPQGTLSQGWSYRWNYRLMANQGYIVILPNRRGTTAFGQEWCEQISGDYIGLNMQDYLSAAREMKKESYVGKIAGCGASYGGFSVYYMAGIHGDAYDCFIAHAGIFDEEYMYYETEEMWFPNWDNGGLTEYSYTSGETGPRGDGKTFGGIQQAGSPWSDAAKTQRHYANSPALNVTKWHTPVLCIHGMMDYRIPYDQGMAAFNCARMMGVPSKLIVFPEENHWILQPQNALFWHRSYFDWLDRWCK